ncbi:MAG: hypothetical protein OQK09_07815 [Colwellia sp.]|nr:hypothetical protein [Colwellia sp.]MCW8865065.1 hypothetical protein [Colwellia sp.]MCW9081407.1 hypothetical protein [Colwellia sp.]
MKLYKVTFINDFLDETKRELLFESDVLSDLKDFTNTYLDELRIENKVWEPFGLPTMGNKRLKDDNTQKLDLSEKEFLFIE